jgi:hypothetical protein
MPYLNPGRKIVIGESATRLREGEPLTHPHFHSLIQELRVIFPSATIQVTTNGSLLDKKTIALFSSLRPLEIILSLNSASQKGRNILMGDRKPQKAIDALKLLQEADISFHGSIVALPHLTGWADLRGTIFSLARASAETIRILMPGYTRLSDPKLVPPPETVRQCYHLLEDLRAETAVPLLAEPPLIEDLKPLMEGVIVGSPAAKAGLFAGDQIVRVNGREPFSRVDAFELLQKAKDPGVFIRRGTNELNMVIYKHAGKPPGVAVAYDIDPLQAKRLRASLCQNGENLALVSRPAYQRWQIAATKLALKNLAFRAVPSLFFGGSIAAAGLLTVEDFQAVLDREKDLKSFKKILLPAIAFNSSGCDLSGSSYLGLSTENIPLQLVE